MPRSVLILAPSTDPHAAALDWALRQQGIIPLWTPSLPTGPDTGYAFRIDEEGAHLSGKAAGGDRFGAIWNRRLEDPAPVCAEADRAFVTWEWKLFQRNLFGLEGTYGNALWVNRPEAAQRAENKLAQLHACRRLGLAFPETVVTNDAEQVDALRRKWGRIVFKSFLMHQWEHRESGRKYAVGVTLLDERSELPADAIAVCPGIYQRYIEKACDLRVTVIGERFFAMSLRKKAGDAYVDWRPHSQEPGMRAEAVALPAAVEDKLRALMRELGLVFGCIDLAVDRQGEVYFLEVNQAGQFLFVEDMVPEHPVLQAMTAMLASGRTDYDTAVPSAVTMEAFRASEAYAALKERVRGKTPDRRLFSLE